MIDLIWIKFELNTLNKKIKFDHYNKQYQNQNLVYNLLYYKHLYYKLT